VLCATQLSSAFLYRFTLVVQPSPIIIGPPDGGVPEVRFPPCLILHEQRGSEAGNRTRCVHRCRMCASRFTPRAKKCVFLYRFVRRPPPAAPAPAAPPAPAAAPRGGGSQAGIVFARALCIQPTAIFHSNLLRIYYAPRFRFALTIFTP
jgi:hypothetical protein